jgi:hypothetical protein
VIDVDVLDVDEVATRTAEGRFSLTVRGPLVVQPEVFEKLRSVLEQIDGVTVEASWL